MNSIKYKILFCLITFYISLPTSYGQGNDYTKQWNQVEEFIKKGLTKSALEAAVKIYETAKKDNNDPQVVKALVFRISLSRNLEENTSVKSIELLEKEIPASKEPARSILNSILADMYWNFLQQNRYRLYNRTQTVPIAIGIKKDDILTWGLEDLHNKIGSLYLLSVKEEKLLQQTKLEPLEAIIIKGNVRYLRPTLFDLLAHRALEYFKNNEADLVKPAYAFEIKDPIAFATANEFAAHKFFNRDSASLHYKALLIYQRLLLFHLNDVKPDALIDADLNRIEFVKQYGVMPNKDQLYITVLRSISEKYSEHTASAQASFLVAQDMYDNVLEMAMKNDSASKAILKKAHQILEQVANKFPESNGGISARNRLNMIFSKELRLTSEKVNVPDKPIRTLVSYKNIVATYLRIVEINPELKKLLEPDQEDGQPWKRLMAAKPLRTWRQPLPLPADHLGHSTEIKIDALPPGEYALIASASEDFSLTKNPVAAQYFHVSDISYINNGREYFVLNRSTGKPITGAKVQVWNQRYDYNIRKYIFEKLELLSSDKNGYVQINEGRKNTERNIRLEITYQKDKLFLNDYQYSFNYNSETAAFESQRKYDIAKSRIFFFTDRSIYRPGQLVYFKGIGITQDYRTQKNKILATSDSIKVELRDANYQVVDTLKFLLNEFGSFNGTFRLPENKLNGNFTLSGGLNQNSRTSFSVEEYKRPKFYGEFEKVKGTYRVNEKINITGFAKAYAGNNIDGANVKYRVTRVPRFLYPWLFWRWGYPRTQPMEITNGELKSGTDGKFTIEFEAIPDLSIDKKFEPVFDYRVEADITDVNGETRSATAIVPVGYKALNLQVTVPNNGTLNIDSLKYLLVSTKNLSGEFQPSKVELKIYSLKTPQALLRSRYWNMPDQFVMNKTEFSKHFPLDEYNDENKKEKWARGELVYSKVDSTRAIGNGQWAIGNEVQTTGNRQLATGNFSEGWYVIEATSKDKYGQEVKDIKFFQLYDMKKPSLPAPEYLWSANVKFMAEPGEKVSFITGTSAHDIFMIQQVNKSRLNQPDKSSYDFFTLNNEKKLFEFPVNEEDRGGFEVNQFFIKDNRLFIKTGNITVPWTNKQLDITFETFREKTLPGSKEKWKVKISGYKGQKLAAEMLAGMYDASLDQFKPHSWSGLNIWPGFHKYSNWNGSQNFSSVSSFERNTVGEYIQQKEKTYDALLSPTQGYNNNIRIRGVKSMTSAQDRVSPETMMQAAPPVLEEVLTNGTRTKKESNFGDAANQTSTVPNMIAPKSADETIDQSQIQIRKNLNETAFFFPELRTDKDGNIEFSFTMPEALTQWKLMTIAHSKELASGMGTKTVITQKEIMVQPNAPRFVREGDKMEFTTKIVNMSDKEASGQSQLQLFNASTMAPVNGIFKNVNPVQNFKLVAGQSAAIKWNIQIPLNYNTALVYRIVAKAGDLSDGEEAAIPVLTNRMPVTETMPLPVKGNTTKNFTFEKLLKSAGSSTLANFSLTTEFTTNPAWYAVQALPYLMEYPYECAEQTFNRYYANSIASKIVNSSPKIKAVFEKWKITDTTALLSNLQKNEELKSVLLQETPWVLQAQSETQQKKNIALLFDMIRMSRELESSLNKLKDMQSSNGGFVWFKGGRDDRYMTQYIITGIGHLKRLGAFVKDHEQKISSIVNTAIPYLDKRLKEDYDYLIKYKVKLNQNNLSYTAVHYLYMRSFFPENSIVKESEGAYNYYREQSKKYWLSQSKYMQALIALSLQRANEIATAKNITRSLKENSINLPELGMYWKEWDNRGWWWYQAPIESQAIMIEAFTEIDKDHKVIDDLKTWLLKNKQTNNWRTTKATADACYALLLQGTDWLNEEKKVTIKLGTTLISSSDQPVESGSGYFKTKIEGNKVKPEMGNISVTVSAANASANKPGNVSTSWGGVYWQYFEDLDKITFAETPLKLNKKLFIEKNSDTGPVLSPVNDGTQLKVGDKIKVRIELRVDRDMEYIHMKDMRASCMEPINVISQYKYQGGLGYYESTKDASTNFFFNYLYKGTYVFEYALFITHAGNFSNGITTIQCMYAPEFTSHSEGVRVNVK